MSTPPIPTRVVVGPHTFTVDSSPATGRLLRTEGALGDNRGDELLIRIDADAPHTMVAQTFLHEILHVVWHQTALRCDHDGDVEERIIQATAPHLLEILRRNPDVVAYLTADL